MWKTIRSLDHSFLWKIRICIHHAKFTMIFVHMERATLERPEETFPYVMMNKTCALKSQKQLHTLNRTLTIISLGGFFVMHRQMLEQVRILRWFYSNQGTWLKWTSRLLCNLFREAASRGVLRKRRSEKMQQIYRRTLMPRCDFNKVA